MATAYVKMGKDTKSPESPFIQYQRACFQQISRQQSCCIGPALVTCSTSAKPSEATRRRATARLS
eukprot:12892055-Prorocentrum_lima.AAC.1